MTGTLHLLWHLFTCLSWCDVKSPFINMNLRQRWAERSPHIIWRAERMGWIMSNQSGPQDRDWGWAGKECRGREGGRDERGKKEGERAVRDNGVAAFISLWIYMWEAGTEREAGKDGRRDGFRERGRAPRVMGEWTRQHRGQGSSFIRWGFSQLYQAKENCLSFRCAATSA